MDEPLIYLSYRRSGAQAHAQKLARWLVEESGVSAFVFGDEFIEAGEHWPTELQKNLDDSSALIVLIDEEWLKYQDEWGRRRIDNSEDWVHREIALSISRGRPVLPILVENASMPPAKALPAELQKLAEIQAVRLTLEHFDDDVKKLRSWLLKLVGTSVGKKYESITIDQSLRLKELKISNFRCFEELSVSFSQQSMLAGDWTCIAGINGAGKSSILQAISLLLMGPDYARELGGRRLQAMRKLEDGRGFPKQQSVLQAKLSHFGRDHFVELAIDDRGPSSGSANTQFWETSDSLLIAGYGASRNFSDGSDRWEKSSEAVRAHASLFDPMARTAFASTILDEKVSSLNPDSRMRAQNILRSVISEVFSSESVVLSSTYVVTAHRPGDNPPHPPVPLFKVAGSNVRALDLPDGFRSSVAWLEDLCARISLQGASPAEATGIVLIDEIDLHLHPSLQRSIISKLRSVFPRIQFIVTSHSPLILSSFDRHELVLLDRNASGGIRRLDRQVIGFSSDEIYNWLMETSPHSLAWDLKLAEESETNLGKMIYQSPSVNEDEAQRLQEEEEEILDDEGIEDGDEF